MSWAVDPPVRLGPVAFAAICQTETHAAKAGPALLGTGAKRPLLILVMGEQGASGLDLSGQRLSADEVEAIYPNAIETFIAKLEAGSD
ncbi:MAG: hypothetical protein KJN93_08075 [Alphaproteobacteria bacterium]|nr:hypothetical protein [Alphaproteobacteria bacterium]